MSLFRARMVNGALVLAALTLSVAVFITEGDVTTSERLARKGNVFEVFRPGEVDSLRIKRHLAQDGSPEPTEAEETLLLRDKDSSDPHAFFLDRPGGKKADPAVIAELLAALEYAAWLRTIEPAEVDRKAFGLDTPHLELRVDMENLSYRLLVGREAATPAGARYAERGGTGMPGARVGLVTRELAEKLARDPRELLGRLLLPYAKSDLAELRLSGAGGDRHLVRDAVGFRLGKDGARADAEAVDAMLFQMARVSAEHYVDPERARRALDEGPRVRVEQVPQLGEPVVVEIGGRCPVQTSEPSVVALRTTEPILAGCVPETVLPSLSAPASELVERRPFSLAMDEVDHVTIVETTPDGPRRMEAVRSGAAFELVEPHKQPVSLDAGNDLIKALVSPNGELWQPEQKSAGRHPDLAALGLHPPRGTVTVRGVTEGSTESVEQVVSFGAADASGRVWLQRRDDGAVLALGPSAAWAFGTDDTWARSRELVDVDKEAVSRITVRRGTASEVIERTANGAVRLAAPGGFDVDAAIAEEWLDVAAHLHAARWLRRDDALTKASSATSIITGEADPVSQVEIAYRTPEGERTAKFSLSRRTVGGYLARWEGEPSGWFVLPTEAARTFQTSPISRAAMSVDVPHLTRLVLRGPGGDHTLERRAGELTSEDGSLSPEAIAEVQEALSALHAEAALHVGPASATEGFSRPELVVEGTTRSASGDARAFSIRFGRVGSHLGRTVQFARVEGIDATFIVNRADVERLLDQL